ncbi:MAG: COX15/CtaA family protein [Phycisphaerae bacterium]|nr:COX15/CtaA family protein [Phycisphaerae bacterium]
MAEITHTTEPVDDGRFARPAVDSPGLTPERGVGDVLTVGFGTTALMWGIGYLCRLPGANVPPWALFVLFLLCLPVGGYVAGRLGRRGIRGGVYAGLVAGAANLLILGSLLGGERANEIRASAVWWLPASLVASAALGALGAAIGSRDRRDAELAPNWPAAFAFVTAATTLMLLAVGGAVTGADHGLAVVDWPNTEGYNMFLYPLSRMTGGIYFEHAHRLIGSLVGLTTLTLAIYVQWHERRRWLKVMAWIALAMVVVQGVLGGLRVTGRFTLSTLPEDTAPNIALAIVHGVFGQMFFAFLVAIGVFLTATWSAAKQRAEALGASTDRALGVALVALVVTQLIIGALVRHFTWALHIYRYGLEAPPDELVARGTGALHAHIAVAVLVAALAIAVGLRAWGLYPHVSALRRLGLTLLPLLGLQVAAGIVALIVTGDDSVEQTAGTFDVIVTTLHQTVGAVLLGLSVALTLCVFRLLHTPK